MTEGASSPLIAAYRLAGRALVPFVPMLLSYRASKGKEDPARRGERYGRAGTPRPAGPLVWMHAASVGETNAVLPLVERLVGERASVLLTTVTVTSAAIAGKRLPSGALHQYAPLDIEPYVDRFLDWWRPDVAIFVESELWPTMADRLASRGVPQLRVNARMSPRSFARWKRLGAAARPLFANAALALAQSEGDALRLRELGLGRARSVGNLKFDVPPPAVEPAALDAFQAAVAGREVFVAASTHEGEETIVAEAHRLVRQDRPTLLTVIVPRHPLRGPSIAETIAAAGLTVALRSRGEALDATTDIYVADTLGELGLFYRAAPVAFVGGTLAPVGGHNPIEAAMLGAAVLHGPHVDNAADIYRALDRGTASEAVRDAAGLAGALLQLFADPALRAARVEAAGAALAPFCGALDATVAELARFLPPSEAVQDPQARERTS